MDDVEYQPTDSNECIGCAFRGMICPQYHTPCIANERKDDKSVIWKKVPDKQIHVSLQEIRQE